MSIWTYANRFSSTPREHQLTLGEGATPLVRSRSIGPQLGIENLFFKIYRLICFIYFVFYIILVAFNPVAASRHGNCL